MIDGLGLLRQAGADQPDAGAVLALNFSNPFPALLARPGPRHAPVWLHVGHSISDAVHPPAARLLDGVGFVIIARDEPNAAFLERLYGPDIDRAFATVAESPYWTLKRRRGG
jgi:hypothetical protein